MFTNFCLPGISADLLIWPGRPIIGVKFYVTETSYDGTKDDEQWAKWLELGYSLNINVVFAVNDDNYRQVMSVGVKYHYYHWCRYLWGTGARVPLDFQLFYFFLATSEPHTLLTFDSMWFPTQKDNAGL